MREQVSIRLAEDSGRLARVQNLVDQLASEGRGQFLWGVGWAFNFYYAQIDWSQADLKALVDRRPSVWNWRFDGRKVRGLEALAEAGPKDAVLAFATQSASMKAHLEKMNFQGRFFDPCGDRF
jgi:hypothetical protein